MSRKIAVARRIIYALAAIAIIAVAGVYLVLPKGITSMTVYADEEQAGDVISMYEGTTTQLSFVMEPAAFSDRTVTYQVADETVLTVDDSGNISALKQGEALITMQAAGFKKNITVKVESAVADISGVDETMSMTEGYVYAIDAEVIMVSEDLEAPAPVYKSEDESIATVDEEGYVTAVEPGETTITVSAGNVTKTIQATVKAKPVVSTPKKTKKKNNNTGGDDGGGWEG